MKSILIILFLGFFGGVAIKASAHPVIFQDGWVLQTETMDHESKYFVGYSLTPRWALGVSRYDLRDPLGTRSDGGFGATVVQLNHLVHRWLMDGSQGNLYLSLGAGTYDPEVRGGSSEFLGRAEIDADWESLKYYTALRYTHLRPDQSSAVDIKQARVGFSPYVLEGEGLNSWFILEWRQLGLERREITPFLRMFYKTMLVEFGRSTDGDFKFNFMFHF